MSSEGFLNAFNVIMAREAKLAQEIIDRLKVLDDNSAELEFALKVETKKRPMPECIVEALDAANYYYHVGGGKLTIKKIKDSP